jgi:ABC-type multidrug transport system fused ATPase/permease subunit
MTRESYRDGELIREFDVRSAATVMSAFIGGLFLVFFLAAFLPWLLSKGMTAAVEGLMNRIGFGTFHANTIWSWLLVLAMFAVFTAFIVVIATGILALYNVLSDRTGMGMRVETRAKELTAGSRVAVAGPIADDDTDDSFDALYADAQRRNIKGRSMMSKDELEHALRRRRRRAPRSTATRRRRS